MLSVLEKINECRNFPIFFMLGMKQINGWYNIQNFNNQCCGQIKVAVIPSLPLSPSKSSKYFKKYDLVEPCNLDLAFFSATTKKTSSLLAASKENEDSDKSSVSLFEQLKQNLQDLDTITRSIKNRTEPQRRTTLVTTEDAADKSSELYLQEQDIETIPVVLEADTTVTSVSSSQTYTREEPSNLDYQEDTRRRSSTLDLRLDVTREEIHENRSTLDDNVGSGTSYQEPSIQGLEDAVSSDDISSHGDNKDEGEVAVETESFQNDSTDDLLEHLKEFERKYKHLKTIVQNDSDFDSDSDSCGVDQMVSPAFSSPRGVGGHHHHQNDGGGAKFFEGVSVAGDSFFDQVVNVSSGEPSKEEIHSQENIDIDAGNTIQQKNTAQSTVAAR